jgi:hypothetical protein
LALGSLPPLLLLLGASYEGRLERVGVADRPRVGGGVGALPLVGEGVEERLDEREELPLARSAIASSSRLALGSLLPLLLDDSYEGRELAAGLPLVGVEDRVGVEGRLERVGVEARLEEREDPWPRAAMAMASKLSLGPLPLLWGASYEGRLERTGVEERLGVGALPLVGEGVEERLEEREPPLARSARAMASRLSLAPLLLPPLLLLVWYEGWEERAAGLLAGRLEERVGVEFLEGELLEGVELRPTPKPFFWRSARARASRLSLGPLPLLREVSYEACWVALVETSPLDLVWFLCATWRASRWARAMASRLALGSLLPLVTLFWRAWRGEAA